MDFLLKTIIFYFLLIPSVWATQNYESHQNIKRQVTSFIKQNTRHVDDEIAIQLSNIDPRLKLKKCSKQLVLKLTRAPIKPGKNTIGVSCVSEVPWRIFLTGYISIFDHVVMAKNTLNKGKVILKNDLLLREVDISTLHTPYITDATAIIGQITKRRIATGQLITMHHLTKSLLIKRGDLVNIIASRPGFSINMKGTSLMNGSSGQLIKVKNNKTKKIIQGIIISQNEVKINL